MLELCWLEVLDKEYFVTAYDLFTYGDVFNDHNIKIVKVILEIKKC